MNKLQMMNLKDYISKEWKHGNYRQVNRIANMKLGQDNLDDTLGNRNIDDADALLGSLGAELQNQAESIQEATAQATTIQTIVDKINEVQEKGQYLYDMDGGLLGAHPIHLSEFISAVEFTNNRLNVSKIKDVKNE